MVDVSNVKGLSFSGHTLNVAERALLSAAIMKKGIEENLAVSFWGKIFGTEANYLVCVGIVQKFSGVPSKKFFYLVSGGENPSSELAEVEAKHAELAAKDEGKPFTGAPDTELREAEEEGQDAYTEAHRLAFTVAVRNTLRLIALVEPSPRLALALVLSFIRAPLPYLVCCLFSLTLPPPFCLSFFLSTTEH